MAGVGLGAVSFFFAGLGFRSLFVFLSFVVFNRV